MWLVPALGRQRKHFEAELVYIGSPRTARATQTDKPNNKTITGVTGTFTTGNLLS